MQAQNGNGRLSGGRPRCCWDQYLSTDPGALGGTWNLGWAEPQGGATGMFSVTLWDGQAPPIATTANPIVGV